jgi:protein SCO1/2
VRRAALATILVCCGLAAPAHAGLTQAELASVGIAPPPDARVPLNLAFRDESGRPTTLAAVAAGRPLVLLLADYTCHTLCGAAVTVAGSEIEQLPLRAGRDYSAAVVGLDPKDGPAEAAALKARELASYPRAAAVMPFLSGDQHTVDRLTRAIGYRYAYDAEHDQLAHPAGLTVLAPDGRVDRVLAGFESSADDLRLALVEAGQGRVGTLADRVRLLCYGFDPVRGVYTPAVMAILRVCGVLTLLVLGGGILLLVRHARRVAAR